jgi:RHS repeat-associated protein
LIFEFVYNNIEWQPGWGVMKGALGALLDGSACAFDQSMLLVALLRQAGFTANYVLGQINMPVAQYDAWFGTDSSSNSYCCYYYAQYANIPGSVPTWDGTKWNMTMSHVWVQVVVSGTTYVLDPSLKSYTRKTPVAGLASILGYNAATFLSDAESGATIDGGGNFVQNMNTTNVRADLTTMTSNLITYIQNNAIGSAPAGTATVDDILGGQAITPVTLPFVWQTALSYELAGDVPTIWTGDVPLAYKTTLQIQYPHTVSGWAIDQTFTSDQLAGTRLTLTFDGGLHPVLSLNGTVQATGSEAQGVGSWNSVRITVNHNAYASQPPAAQWWQSFIYASTDNLYLIGNAWGSAGRGQADYHKNQAAGIEAAGFVATEPVVGELMSIIWWNWVAQTSRVGDLAGRINSTYMNFFHQVGMVYNMANNVAQTAHSGTDIGGVSGFSSTLNYDFTQLSRTNTVVAMHGVALEAATLEQFTGLVPAATTTTIIDKANRTAAVTIGGTVTVGNTLTITVNDAALAGGTRSDTYTVVGGDTLTTIATTLAAAINADSNLSAIGVTASSNGPVILISSTSVNQTTYSSSTSVGATETISIAFLKIYKGTSTNWNSGANISAALVANGYNSTDMSNIYSSYLSGGNNSVVLADQPSLLVNNSFTGWGDWIFPTYSNNGGAFGLINNVAKGGLHVSCGFVFVDEQGNVYVGPPTCTVADTSGADGNTDPQPKPNPGNNPNGQTQSNEPIGLFSGDYFYNRTDISVGSQGFPYGLGFSRFYNSSNQYKTGPLGWGWTHNHLINAKVNSNGLMAMGDLFAAQGAACITELFVAMDIATDTTQPIAKMVTLSIADKWWVDQLVNNTVVILMAENSYIFVKQPNGSYTAPAAFPSTLTLSGGLYTLTTPQGVKFNFNSKGHLSTWVSPAGVTVTYTYTSGLLTSISNGLGRTITLNYTGNKLTSVTDGNGRTVQYGYDGSGNLGTFTDATSNAITYQYDQPGRLTKVFLPRNLVTPIVTNVYDSLSRVKTQSNTRSQQWSYYFAGARTQEVDPLGNSTVSYFNRLGQTTRFINALGFETDSQYDGMNRLTKTTLPEGNAVQLTYDANNNVLTKTFVPKSGSGLSNIVFTYTYDPTWAKLKTVVDGNSKTYTYGYDSVTGNLLTITKPVVGGLTPKRTLKYNSRGQLLSAIDETGIQSQLTYDVSTEKLLSSIGNTNWLCTVGGTATVGNVLTITVHDAGLAGGVKSDSYTVVGGDTLATIAAGLAAVINADTALAALGIVAYVNGAVLSLSTSSGNTTTFTGSTSGGATETLTFAAGLNLTASFGYDSVGNANSVTDPNTNQTTFVFDNERRLTKVTSASPFNFVQNRSYDVNGNLSSVQRQVTSAPTWQTVSYAYTLTDKVFTVTDPLGHLTTWVYDGADRVQTVTDAQGRVFQYAYDALNRISTVTDPSSTISDTETYTNNGLKKSTKDGSNNLTQYAYDGLDRPSLTTFADSTTNQFTSYDGNGNLLTAVTRSGSSITLTYDALNRLSTKAPAGQATVTYGYDLANRLNSISKPTVGGDPSTGTFQRFFDTSGRFTQEQYPDGKTVTHVLDSNGNRTKTTWPDGYFVTRSFDQLNRLTNIYLNGSGTPSLTYSYDQLSRRSSVAMGNGASTSYSFSINNDLSALVNNFVGSANSYSLTRNNVGQILGFGVSDSSFVWHPAGTGTTSYGTADNVNKYPTVGGATLTYDGNKNLTFDGTWTYSYDTENHLLSATSGGVTANYVYDPNGRQAQKTVSGTATRFIYDGLRLIATYDGSGTLLNRYVHGPGVDEPAIQVTSGGVQSFFHRDFQGSVVSTTNSSGAVTNKYAYSPFGESAALSGTIFGYTGQRYDTETGLYYYKARYYSPAIGRFLQTDPIGYAGGDLNLYNYVGNDPLNHRDPLGLTQQGNNTSHSYGGNSPGEAAPGWGPVDPFGNPYDLTIPINGKGNGSGSDANAPSNWTNPGHGISNGPGTVASGAGQSGPDTWGNYVKYYPGTRWSSADQAVTYELGMIYPVILQSGLEQGGYVYGNPTDGYAVTWPSQGNNISISYGPPPADVVGQYHGHPGGSIYADMFSWADINNVEAAANNSNQAQLSFVATPNAGGPGMPGVQLYIAQPGIFNVPNPLSLSQVRNWYTGPGVFIVGGPLKMSN